MNIETNFGMIDQFLKDERVTDNFAMFNVVTAMIQNELSKIIESAENDKLANFTDSAIICVNKGQRGFRGIIYNYDEDTRTYAFNKDRNCLMSDEGLKDEMAYLNMKYATQDDYYYDNQKEKVEIPTKENKKPFKEKDLELLIIKDLNVIEDGMKLIKNQYQVENGYIDILARDKNGKLCIIELKVVENDSKIIQQSVYYPTQFDEEVRMITIAPNYTKKIAKSLISLKNVEMKTYVIENNTVTIHNF